MIETYWLKKTIYGYRFLYNKEQFVACNLIGRYIPSEDSPVYQDTVIAIEYMYEERKNSDGTIGMVNDTVIYENTKTFHSDV